ncbi:MAG TPA: DNA repair protein RadA, partial [Alphaproteobacteria bacterium]|nr:DNA repair protein RadA [Alphaproteobacteria bacterium]
MAKNTSRFVCQNCGAVFPRWAGRCEACGEWNTIVEEETASASAPKATGGKGGRKIEFVGLDGVPETSFRLKSGIKELDRVCGGGLVAGSVLLIGGDPGIGKSTLLLQVTAALSAVCNVKGAPVRCVYISGEESVDQVRLRAARLGLAKANVELASATNVRDIIAT